MKARISIALVVGLLAGLLAGLLLVRRPALGPSDGTDQELNGVNPWRVTLKTSGQACVAEKDDHKKVRSHAIVLWIVDARDCPAAEGGRIAVEFIQQEPPDQDRPSPGSGDFDDVVTGVSPSILRLNVRQHQVRTVYTFNLVLAMSNGEKVTVDPRLEVDP